MLDLGCGAGEPIAAWIRAQGHALTGADASAAMLNMARARMPDATWLRCDMREMELGRTFDAVIAWDSLFHLSPDDQRRTLRRIADHLAPGGALLTTVGPRAGEAVGRVGPKGGERPVYHASLSLADYARTLDRAGVEIRAFVAEDPGCGGHSVLMARRR